MSLPAGMILILAPVLASLGILASAVGEALRAQRLWRSGKELAGEVISDRTEQQRREVVCRFDSGGRAGVTRRLFSASRRPLEGFRGEPVVLVDPGDPTVSRILLEDEVHK